MTVYQLSAGDVPAVSCVYVITNKINGKCYVGKSVNLAVRVKKHREFLMSGTQVLYKATRKYGPENFTLQILSESLSDEELLKAEVEAIQVLNTYIPNGYNMTRGGEGMAGYVQSEATKDRRRKGAKANPERWSKFAEYVAGPRSAQHKANISASLKGKNTWTKDMVGDKHPCSVPVLVFEPNSFCGKYFNSATEVAKTYKVDKTSVGNWSSGKTKCVLGLAVARVDY